MWCVGECHVWLVPFDPAIPRIVCDDKLHERRALLFLATGHLGPSVAVNPQRLMRIHVIWHAGSPPQGDGVGALNDGLELGHALTDADLSWLQPLLKEQSCPH